MVFFRRNREFDPTIDEAVDLVDPPATKRNEIDEIVTNLRVLGLADGATWEEITDAHRRLVSDLTPGPGASHQKVALAQQFLTEVNEAYASLRMRLAVA